MIVVFFRHKLHIGVKGMKYFLSFYVTEFPFLSINSIYSNIMWHGIRRSFRNEFKRIRKIVFKRSCWPSFFIIVRQIQRIALKHSLRTWKYCICDSPVRILLLVSAAFRSHKARHNSRTNQNWNSTFSFGHFHLNNNT